MQRKVATRSAERDDLAQRLDGASRRGEELQGERDRLAAELAQLSLAYQAVREQLDQAESRLRNMDALVAQRESLRGQVAGLEGERDDLRDRLAQAAASHAQTLAELDRASAESAATRSAAAALQAQIEASWKREEEWSALIEKARGLWAAVGSEQLVAAALRSACELVGGSAALLAVRDPRTLALEVVGAEGVPPELLGERMAWGAAVGAVVMHSRTPWVTPMRDVLPPALIESVEAAGMRQLIGVPFATGPLLAQVDDGILLRRPDRDRDWDPEVTGALLVYAEQLDEVSADHVEGLRVLADHAAGALKSAFRRQRMQAELNATRSLNVRLLGREHTIADQAARIQRLERLLGRI